MNVLKEAVYRAVHGEGGLVFIHGEAGIGKTRLVRELGAYARSRGVQVLYGRCPALFRMDGVPPYILWKEVIKDYLETCTPEQLYRVVGYYPAEVAKLVPEISQKLRSIPQSFPISPEQEQNRLFEAVSQFITNISRETPLLVVLDDLQWTDPSSLLLLHYLARGVQKTPLLLFGAYRSTDIDAKHPLTPVLMELNRERLPQSMQLKRMSLSDVSEIIRNILEQDDVPTEFCELVYEKTKGNPFFAEEVIRSLKEEEAIYREGNKWAFKEISNIEFPDSVRNVVKARLSRLDEECQNVLTLASFVGNDFTLEAMCAITGIEENKLLEMLDKILKTGLIKERKVRGEGVCSFADILVRDVVYEEVSLLKREKLHGTVGDALEKVYAEKIDEHFGELAHHFLESGDKDKALGYFLKASERAQKVYAHDETFSCLQHALELLEERNGDVEEKARVTEKLGQIKEWTGEAEASIEYWNRSLALWNQLKNKKNTAKLHVRIAHVLWDDIGDKQKASEHHKMALEILEKEPESAELANLYEDISYMLWRTGELAKAYPLAKKALELAERLKVPEVVARCYNNLGFITEVTSADLESALRLNEKGLKIALENNCIEQALMLYMHVAGHLGLMGKFQKAHETNNEGYELARKVGNQYPIIYFRDSLAQDYINMGEMQKAKSMYEDNLTLAKRNKNPSNLADALIALGGYYFVLGEWDKSLQLLTETGEIFKNVVNYQALPYVNLMIGRIFLEKGDYAKAEKHLIDCDSAYEEAGDELKRHLLSSPWLSALYLKKREIEKAEVLIAETHEYATRTKSTYLIAYAEMFKAMLSREQKNWEQSIEYFKRSLAGLTSLDGQKWQLIDFAYLLYEYGLTYLARNEKSAREEAYSLLSQALKIYERVGAQRRIEEIKSIIGVQTRREIVGTELMEGVLSRRVATGHVDLDKLMYGGIPSNSAVVLTSPSCNERDLLVKSFLETGVKKGEVTFYVTTDPGMAKPLAEFQSSFCLFVCNPQADAIIEDSPNVVKLKGVENLTDISIALTSAMRKLDPSVKGPRRACIDIVSDALLQHHAVQTRKWLAALTAELKSMGFTTLVVVDPRMHPPEELYAILGLFEGEIDIRERETEKGTARFLKIRRMSGQEFLEDELLLKKGELQKKE
jgi:predicted ATPase/KaiC/GvpD/RAD55 family RecA-like ATPase